MNFIINAIVGILTFLGSKSLNLAKIFAQFVILIGVNSVCFITFIAFLSSVAFLFIWLFDKFNYLLSYFGGGFNDKYVILGFKFLQSLGIWDGFVDALNVVSVGLLLLFTIFLSKLFLKILIEFRFIILSLIVAAK